MQEIVQSADDKPSTAMQSVRKSHHQTERPPFECIALLLQGGGALGSYQAGVYQALAEAESHPDWVAGISIGAINSALIAGNPPERAGRAAAGILGGGQRRRSSTCPTLVIDILDRRHARSFVNQARAFERPDVRRAALLRAAHSAPPFLHPPGRRGDELLRHAPLRGDARAAGRFRSHQCQADALQRRRGERAHRQLRLLRHRRPTSSGPSTSWPAARCRPAFPATEIDGEYLLGRRTRLQHAAAMGARQPAAAGHPRLPGRSVERARRAAPRPRRRPKCARRRSTIPAAPAPGPTRSRRTQKLRVGARQPDQAAARRDAKTRRDVEAAAARRPIDKVCNIVHLIYRSQKYEGSPRTTSSPAGPWRSIGRPATTTPSARCGIRKCCSVPTGRRRPHLRLGAGQRGNEPCRPHGRLRRSLERRVR